MEYSMSDSTWELLTSIVIHLGLAILISVILKGVHLLFIKQVKKNGHLWFKSMFEICLDPTLLAIWAFAAIHITEDILDFYRVNTYIEQVKDAKGIVVVVILTYFAFEWKERVAINYLSTVGFGERGQLDRATVGTIQRLLTFIIIVIAVMQILDILGVPFATILAFGGAGAFAAGLAAKDVIANFFGGLMIFLTRPFAVGDWISSPDKNLEGVVQNIGWYMTTIRSLERRPIYVPNALFSSIILVNPSRMKHRKIYMEVGVRYVDIGKVRIINKEISEFLNSYGRIDQNEKVHVHLFDFADSALMIKIECYSELTESAEYRTTYEEVLFEIEKIISRNGAEIPFPTQVVRVEN
jgi:MscS family membrane protein